MRAGTVLPESRKVMPYQMQGGKTLVHTEWRTAARACLSREGREVVSGAKAVWHPQDEPALEYADFDWVSESLAFNLSPGEAP